MVQSYNESRVQSPGGEEEGSVFLVCFLVCFFKSIVPKSMKVDDQLFRFGSSIILRKENTSLEEFFLIEQSNSYANEFYLLSC